MTRDLLLVLLALFLAACTTSSTSPHVAPADIDNAMPVEDYRIGVDDVVQVTVWKNPDLSVSMPVRPDGKISIPLIGDVQAGGRTAEQVAAEVRERLSTYVRDPNVTVILTQLHNNEYLSRVRVTGAVMSPTSLPYRKGMTVLDAVLASGGISEFAAPNRAKLYRRENGKTSVYDIRLGGILNSGDLATNYELLPGDIITVPERLF
ncbi:MAG TPA: sugar ABC transporter substrate-binding protein [Gammaproteobacteria bacterium]|nr:sugar ABC transporter substrate-binding protein [Gammaproteobacteria bacterium]